MNILVTGASGFVGKSIRSEWLKQNKDDNLILLTSKKIDGFTCIMHNNYTYQKEDFINCGINHIDKVLHIGHYLAENSNDGEISKGNLSSINNTVHLLNTLPNIPDTFVYCSTMAVYGINRNEIITENTSVCPENPYAVSKLMIEHILKEWAMKNEVNLHIMRLSHIYGPNDQRRYTIPIWLQAAKQGQAIRVFANPNMQRNCLYVSDCARFLIRALYLNKKVEVMNLASSHNATMGEIAQICKAVSRNPYEIEIQEEVIDDENIGLKFAEQSLREQFLGKEEHTLYDGLRIEEEYYREK